MALQDRIKQHEQLRESQASGRYGGGATASQPEGTVTHIETFTTPIHASVDGDPVRILATGNVTGFSPGYLLVDREGMTGWLPMSDVRVIDLNFLPVTQAPVTQGARK